VINPWKILGVHRKSSDAEIRDAYYALAKKHHPDTGSDGMAFSDISKAYHLIGNAVVRLALLNKKLYHAKPCSACKGAGATSKTKSLTGKSYTACNGCGGAGLIIKEDKYDGTIELRGASGLGGKGRDKKR